MKKLLNSKQVDAIGRGFWKVSELLFGGGFIAGIMITDVPLMKVIVAFVLAFVFALIGFIFDGITGDDGN